MFKLNQEVVALDSNSIKLIKGRITKKELHGVYITELCGKKTFVKNCDIYPVSPVILKLMFAIINITSAKYTVNSTMDAAIRRIEKELSMERINH